MKKGFSRCLGMGLMLLIIDALLKYLVYFHFPSPSYSSSYPYGGIAIFHNVFGIDFCITKVTNFGGAWGIFASYPTVLLIIRSGTLLSVFIYACFLNDQKKRRIPLFLIIVGALGNILDCWIYGFVVDMFHFTFWGYSFPVFNFADSMIFLGISTLVLQSLFQKRKKHVRALSDKPS